MPLNLKLLANPGNWLIVWLMLAIGGMAITLISVHSGNAQGDII